MPKNLKNLPQRSSMRKSIKNDNNFTNYGNSYCHSVNNIYPYTRIDRILRKHIGQHINIAFKKYCEKIPVYQQHIFWEYIRSEQDYTNSWRRRFTFLYYDKNGIIRENKKTIQKVYKVRSWDFVKGVLNKKTNTVISVEEFKLLRYKNNYNPNDFEFDHPLKGFVRTFYVKDYLYYKTLNIQKSKARKEARRKEKEQREKKYNFKIINLNEKDTNTDNVTPSKLSKL